MDIVTKKDLSDNYGKPVFYFTKFFPEGYKPPKNIMKRTANEEYQGSIFFTKETANRILSLDVWKTCIYPSIYLLRDGFCYNIDWNDSEYIEVSKRAGNQMNVLQIVSIIINDFGYTYQSEKWK